MNFDEILTIQGRSDFLLGCPDPDLDSGIFINVYHCEIWLTSSFVSRHDAHARVERTDRRHFQRAGCRGAAG